MHGSLSRHVLVADISSIGSAVFAGFMAIGPEIQPNETWSGVAESSYKVGYCGS